MGSVLLNGMTRSNTSTECQNASTQFDKEMYNDCLYLLVLYEDNKKSFGFTPLHVVIVVDYRKQNVPLKPAVREVSFLKGNDTWIDILLFSEACSY